MSAHKKKSKESSAPSRKINFIIPLTTLGIISILIVSSLFQSSKNPLGKTVPKIDKELTVDSDLIDLPHPKRDSSTSVEKALNNRRSYRNYQNDKPISFASLSQLLWSAQGVTANWGGRTVTSTKSVYPLSIYIIANQVTDLQAGLYKYLPGDLQPTHQLYPIYQTDLQPTIIDNTDQYSLQHAPLILVIAGNMDKMTQAHQGLPCDTEVYLEAGQTAQNLFLQTESLKLGMTVVSSFDQELIKEVLQIPQEETLIYLIPIGHPKK